MKKHRVAGIAHFVLSVFVLLLCAAFVLTSCKTLPSAKEPIDPFTLFDEGADMYVHIPADGNKVFLQKLVRSWTDEISDSDLNEILLRTESVYAALYIDREAVLKNTVFFQLVLYGNYPSLFFTAALTPKRGWTDITETADTMLFKRKRFLDTFELALADKGTVFFSNKNVLPMQKKYVLYRISGLPAPDWPVMGGGTEAGGGISVRSLMNDDALISLYMPRAGSLLPKMVGSAVELAVNYAVGTAKPYKDEFVIVRLQLQMADERALKIAEKLFRFAVLGTNIIVRPEAGNMLILDNFVVSPAVLAGFRPKR